MLNASNGYKEGIKNLWSPKRLIRKKTRATSSGLKQGLLSNGTDDDSDNDVGCDNNSTSNNILSQHDAVALEDARINKNKRQQAILSNNNKVGGVEKFGKQRSAKPTIVSQKSTNDSRKESEADMLTSKGQENAKTKTSEILAKSSTSNIKGLISITYDNQICNSVQTHDTKGKGGEGLLASERQVSRENNNTEWEVFGDSTNKDWTEKVNSRQFLAPTTTIQSQKLENSDVKSLFETSTVSKTPTTVVAVVSNYQAGLPWEQPFSSQGPINVHRTGRLGITERIDVFDPHLDTTEHSYDDYMPRRLNRDLSNPSLDGSGILSMSESFEVDTFTSSPPEESDRGNLQKKGNINQLLGFDEQQGRSNEANRRGGGKGNSHSLKKLFSSLPDGTGLLELDTGSPMSQSITATSTSRSLLASPQIQPSNEIYSGQQSYQHPPNHTNEDSNQLFNHAGHSYENILSNFTDSPPIGPSLTQTRPEHWNKVPLDRRGTPLDESNQQAQYSGKEIARHTPSKGFTSRQAKGESNSMRKIFSSIYNTANSLQFDAGSPMSQSFQGASTESTYSSTDTVQELNFAGDKALSLIDPYTNCVHAENTRHQATVALSDYDDNKVSNNLHIASFPKARLPNDAALTHESKRVGIQSVGNVYVQSFLECDTKIDNKQIETNQSIVHLASVKNDVFAETVPGTTPLATNKSTKEDMIQASFSLDVTMPPPGNVPRLAATFHNLLSLDYPNRDETATQATARVNEVSSRPTVAGNRSETTAHGDESFGTIHRYAFPSLKSFHPTPQKAQSNEAQYDGTFNGHWGQEYSLNNLMLMNHKSKNQREESVAHPVSSDAGPAEQAVSQKKNINVSNSIESIHDELLIPHTNKSSSQDIDFADGSPESFFRVVAERDTNLFSADKEAKQGRSSLPLNRGFSSYSDMRTSTTKMPRRTKSVTFNAAKDSIHLIESRDHLQLAASASFENGSDIGRKLEFSNNSGDSHLETENSSGGKKQNETSRRNIDRNLELQQMDRPGNMNQISNIFEEDLSEDFIAFDGDANPFINNDQMRAIAKENTYAESVVPVATATHIAPIQRIRNTIHQSLTDRRDDSSGNNEFAWETAFVTTFDSVKDTVEYTTPYVQEACPSREEGTLIKGETNGHETGAASEKAQGKPQRRQDYLGIAPGNQATFGDVFTDDSIERISKVDHNSTSLHLHKAIQEEDNQNYGTSRTVVPNTIISHLDNQEQRRPGFFGNCNINLKQMENQKWNEPYEKVELEHDDVHRQMRRVRSSSEPLKQTTFDVCAQDAMVDRMFIGHCSPGASRPGKSDGSQEEYVRNTIPVRDGTKKNKCNSLEQGSPSFLDNPQPNLENMHYLSSEKPSAQRDKVLETCSIKKMLPTNNYSPVESLNHAILNDIVADGISKTQSTIENAPKLVHIQPSRQHVDDKIRVQNSNGHEGNSNKNLKAHANQSVEKAFSNLGNVVNVIAKKTPRKRSDWSNSVSMNEVAFEVDWAEDTVLNRTSKMQISNEHHLTVPTSQLSRQEGNKRHTSNYGQNLVQTSTVFLGNSNEATERMENLNRAKLEKVCKPDLKADAQLRTGCVRVESHNLTTFDDAFAQSTTKNAFNALNLEQRSTICLEASHGILGILDSNQFEANLQPRDDIGVASLIGTSVDDDLTRQSTMSAALRTPCAIENDQSHSHLEFHRNREDTSGQPRVISHRKHPSQISAIDFVGAETARPDQPTGGQINRKDEAAHTDLVVARQLSRPRPNQNSTVHNRFAHECVDAYNEPCAWSVPKNEAKKIVSPLQVLEKKGIITTKGEGLDSTSNLYADVFRTRADVQAETSNIPWVFDISKNNSIHEETAASENFTDIEMGKMNGESLTELTDEKRSNQLANIATATLKSNIRRTYQESDGFAPEYQAPETDNSIPATQHIASKDGEAYLRYTESSKSSFPTHQQQINVVSNAINVPEPPEVDKRYHTFVRSPEKQINCQGITGGGTSHLRWNKITSASSKSNIRQTYQESDNFAPEHQATERDYTISATHDIAIKDHAAHMWNTERNESSFPTHQQHTNVETSAIYVPEPSEEEKRYLSLVTSPDKQIIGKTDARTSHVCKNEITTNASESKIRQTYNEPNRIALEHQATEKEISIAATQQMAIKDREAHLWHTESGKSSLPTHQQVINIGSTAINVLEASDEEKRYRSLVTSPERQLNCQLADDKSVSHLREIDISNNHSMKEQSTDLHLERYKTSAESRNEVSRDKVKNVEPQRCNQNNEYIGKEGLQRNLELKESTVNLYEHPISRMRKLSDGFATTEKDGTNPRPFNKLEKQLSCHHSSLRQQVPDEGKVRMSSDVLPHIHQQGVDEWPSDQQQKVYKRLDKSVSSIKRRNRIDDIPVEFESPPNDRIRRNSFDSNSAVNDSDGVLSNADSTKYYRNLLQFNKEQQVNKRTNDNVHAHVHTPENNFRRSKSYESLIDEQNKLLTFSLERQRRYHQHTITTCSFDTISTVKSSERQCTAPFVNEKNDTYDRFSHRDTHTMFEPQPVLRMNPDDFEQYKAYSTSRSNFLSRYHQDRSVTTNLYENDLDSSSNNSNDPSFTSGMFPHDHLRYQERHNTNKRGRPSFYNMKSLLSDDTYTNETEEIKTISGISLLGVEDYIKASSAPVNGKDTTTIDNEAAAAAETQQDIPGFLCCSFLLADAIDFTIRAKNWGKETK